MRVAMCFLWTLLLASEAHAANLIGGRVVDRNGQPLPRAIVSLSPGNVELVTDQDGRFVINYLRDESGERVKLDSKTDYTLEVFLTGFHTFTVSVPFRRGELEVETVTMVEESLDVQDLADIIDPARYSSSTQSSGASYIGQ
jgi:hypothetical protein